MTTEADTVAELAGQAAAPFTLEPGQVYLVADGEGSTTKIDTDAYAPRPRHTNATRVVRDTDSFVAYLEKHGTIGATEIYADTKASRIVAIIDSHDAIGPNWQKHTVTLQLEFTTAWEAWIGINGRLLPQAEFAEFLEQRQTEIRKPAAGDMLAIAQKLLMTKSLEYESAERLEDGQTELVYKEKVATKGLGQIEVPNELELVLQPYVNGPRSLAHAAFRTRLDGARLMLGIVLIQPDEILEGIFLDMVAEIRDGRPADDGRPALAAVPHPIYFGKP